MGSGVVMWLLCEKHEFANWVATLAVFGTLVFIISLLFVRLGWFETGRWSVSDYKNKTSQIASSCDMSSDGCLHRRKASGASCAASEGETRRRSAGRRKSSEDGVAVRGLSLHCDPWPPGEGPVSADVGDSIAWVKGFYTWVIMFVMTQQRTDSDRPLKTCFFTDGQKIQWFLFFFFFLLFCPNTVTAYVKGYTLYCIYAMQRVVDPRGCLRPVPSNPLWFCWRRQHSPDGFSTQTFLFPVQRHPECCFSAPTYHCEEVLPAKHK